MAYYIFLKSLRRIEEFRKNPHVKIPPKSPINFQSLGKFKNPIFIRKEFFLRIRPTRPSLARDGPLCTAGRHARARPILAYTALAYLPKPISSSSLRSPATTPSSSVTTTRDPPVSFVVSPASANPKHASPHASPQLIAPRLPASIIATPIKAPYSPALIPRLESPLTPSPAINGVGRKSSAITHRHFIPGAPPAPIKGEHHPRVAPHLSLLLFPSLHA
jgi:hypothetical protein